METERKRNNSKNSKTMKFYSLVVFLALFNFSFKYSPNTLGKSPLQVVKAFTKAYNAKNYKLLKQLTTFNIEIVDSGYKVLDSQAAFIDLVEWGEVFQSKNIVTSIKKVNGKIVVRELQDNKRVQFLHGKPVECDVTYTIVDGKITKIEVQVLNIDVNKQPRAEFYEWVEAHHPEEMKQLWQLNKAGATTMLKCIEFFEQAQASQ